MRNRLGRQQIAYLVQITFFILIALFIGRYFVQQWSNLRDRSLSVDALWLVIAGLGFTLGLGTIPIGTTMIVYQPGKSYSLVDLWHTFYLSQITKYLPGGIWALPSRAYLFKRRGLSGSAAIEAVFWEAGLLVSGACGVALLGLPLLPETHTGTTIVLILGSFVLVFSSVVFLTRTTFYRRLLKRLPVRFRIETQVPLKKIMPAVLAYAVTWLTIGFSFAALVRAFDETISLAQGSQLAGLFAAAWVMGFLAFFAPGGIGVRDSFIILGTQQLLNEPLPLVIAIVARLCWTIAEVIGLIVMSLIYMQRKNQPSPESLSE